MKSSWVASEHWHKGTVPKLSFQVYWAKEFNKYGGYLHKAQGQGSLGAGTVQTQGQRWADHSSAGCPPSLRGRWI